VEDLYVKAEYRRSGIGTMLLETVMTSAAGEGISFVHLQVLDWNQQAIDFYRKYKPVFDAGWINVLIPLEKSSS
jgi:ribosomal protein S18 acetylase RimI-like enzyme